MARKMRDSGVEWIGEVPEGWEMKYLSQSVSQVKNRNDGLKEKNLLSLSYGKIKRKDIDSIGGLLPASFEGYNIIAPNDIVLRLTDLQNDQHSLRVGLSHENGIVTSAYTTIRPCDRINAVYLFYSLFAFDIAKGFYGMGAGVRQGLNYDEVKQIKLLSPPLPEQRRIADYLDEKCAAIDGAVDELKRGIEDCKAWKKAIIFEAVTGKANVLAASACAIRRRNCYGGQAATADKKNAKVAKRQMRDSGIPWIGEIPEGWGMVKASKTFSIITDFVASGSFADLRENVKYLDQPDYAQLVRTADVSGKSHEIRPVYISKESYNFLAGSNLFGGELLLPNIGASVGDVYIVPVIYERMSLAPNAIMAKGSMCDKFYFYYFSCEAGRLSLEDIAESTAQPKFNKTDFRNLRLPAPPLTEQQAIADYLDEKCAAIDALVAEKEKLIADLEAYKKSLIFELVTGKREVA